MQNFRIPIYLSNKLPALDITIYIITMVNELFLFIIKDHVSVPHYSIFM